MTRFADGPAKAQTLMLKRAPFFLRVTECKGKFDALNEVEDTPRTDETLYAYQLVEMPGWSFVDGPKCRGRYATSNYRLVSDPPDDATMRNNMSWTKWCESNKQLCTF